MGDKVDTEIAVEAAACWLEGAEHLHEHEVISSDLRYRITGERKLPACLLHC